MQSARRFHAIGIVIIVTVEQVVTTTTPEMILACATHQPVVAQVTERRVATVTVPVFRGHPGAV